MADEGWPAEPAWCKRQESPFCLGNTGTNCNGTDVERSLCGTTTQTLLGVWFTSSLEQAPHTAQLRRQKAQKRVETCHYGWPGTGRREQNTNGCHRSNSPSWVGRAQSVWFRSEHESADTHCEMHSAMQTSCSLSIAQPVGLATQAAIHPPTPEMLNIWGRAVTASEHSLGDCLVLFLPCFLNLAAYILTSQFQGCWAPNHSFDFRQSQLSSSEKQTFI